MDYKNALDFRGKVAVVTGGGGSIGREIAAAFANCGANVAVLDLNLDAANETVSLLDKVDGGHIAVSVNVTDTESIDKAVDEVVKKFGKIDFLSNNAGVTIRKPILDFTEKEYDFVCDVNMKGAFFVGQAVARVMIENGFGRIVNTASVSACRGGKDRGVYAATKGGVLMMTKVMANEWAQKGITVNAIGPGFIETNLNAHLRNDPKVLAGFLAKTPMGRMGQLDEVAAPVLFLCSPLANFITGSILYPEGGRLID